MKHPVLAVVLAIPLVLTSAPSLAGEVEESIENALKVMGHAETDETIEAAAWSVIALGGKALPNLTQRLASATNDEERIQISYILSTIVGQAKFSHEAIELPPALPALVGELLLESQYPQLEANLANLSGFIAPNAQVLGPGLLALLERTEDEALRATTSAAISLQGKKVLPLVRFALHNSKSDRFSGDLAWLLYDTDLTRQSIASLRKLVKSDNEQARRSAARTLDRGGWREK